eukprot:1187120-Prorocentrum_minimum.AAC.5
MASVSTPDSQTIAIQPFDKTAIKDIERAIMQSDIGINPSNDGNVIRLIVPALTTERRKELAKLVSKLGEDGKADVQRQARVPSESKRSVYTAAEAGGGLWLEQVALRNVRRDATKQLQKLEKDGSSSKDMCAAYCEAMDELTNTYVKKVEELIKKKEAEVMKV